MNKENVIEKLRDDEHYYGDFGKKYLSNSDIKALLTNPLALGKPSEPRPAFLVGGYFHTAILEPDKLKKYLVIPSSTRNTKVYKEMSGGELCLLQHEVDDLANMLLNINDYVGQRATFTYFQRTQAGSYRHPLFKCIRNYE